MVVGLVIITQEQRSLYFIALEAVELVVSAPGLDFLLRLATLTPSRLAQVARVAFSTRAMLLQPMGQILFLALLLLLAVVVVALDHPLIMEAVAVRAAVVDLLLFLLPVLTKDTLVLVVPEILLLLVRRKDLMAEHP